jgi:transposase
MQDKELYQQILGLGTPWSVSRVELNMDKQQVDVFAEHPARTTFCCPECEQPLGCYDHIPERQWRHLDSCQFKTILHARVPRVNCPEHGVKQVDVPWAEKSSRFTILFERFAIDVLLATQTVKGVMSILGTKWDQTWAIVQRAVARGKARKETKPLPHIGIDEKAFSKGHSYITLLYDLDNSTVETILDSNIPRIPRRKQHFQKKALQNPMQSVHEMAQSTPTWNESLRRGQRFLTHPKPR